MTNVVAIQLESDGQIKGWIEEIERALDRYSQIGDQSPELLTQAMRYSLLGGGKRLRPLLVLAACEMCGGSLADAIPAACAVEMVHAYSLVHDDLPGMDDDDMRRGKATCHVQFNHATAILVGDSLQSLAFELLAGELTANSNVTPVQAVKCIGLLAKAAGCQGMAGGQQDDLMANSLPATETTLLRIHRRKTGALLSVSLEIGGVIAGASQLQLEKLRDFGQNVGLAFQVTDDLLDATGDASTVGKRTRKDDTKGKLTYPAMFGIEESRRKAAELIQQAESCLQSFGAKASHLQDIARFVLERQQ